MAISARSIRAGSAYVELMLNDNKLVRGLKSAQRKLGNFGQGLKSLGKSMTFLGAGAITPFAASIKVFTEFSDQMASVRAVTGAAQADFERLNQTAKDLGSSTSFSASEVAQGMQFLGMAGFNTEQILAGIPAVLNLARAGAVELGEAADIASNIGGAFGLTADEIQRVADVMATTASNSNTSISMMGESFKYAAAQSGAAGQSIEDTAAAIGILGNSGVQASGAGTDLALIMKKLAKLNPEDLLGVETKDSAGNIRSIVDVMQELGEASKNLSGSEKLNLFNSAFDRAAKSALIMSSSGQSFTDLQTKVKNSAGSVDQMAAVMEDTTGGAFRQFKSAVEGLAISVGEALAPSIRAWTTDITSNIQSVGTWLSQNQALVGTLAQVAAGLLGGGIAMSVLGSIAGGLSSVFGLLATAITSTGAAIGVTGSLIAGLFTPLGALVGLIGLVQATFIDWGNVGQGVTAFLGEAFNILKNDALAAFSGISDAMASGDLGLAAQILWATLKVEWQRGLDFLRGLWGRFEQTMFGSIFNLGKGIVQQVWSWVKFFGSALGTMFKGFFAFAQAVMKAWNSVSKFFRKAWAKVKGVVKGTDSAAEIAAIEKESSAGLSSQALGTNTSAPLQRALAEQQRLIDQAKRQRDAKSQASLTPEIKDSPAVNQTLKDLKLAMTKRGEALDQLKSNTGGATLTGQEFTGPVMAAGEEAMAGGMAFDSMMGDMRNTALELGTSDAQAAIVDALTGRNDPQKDIAKNTKETAQAAKKSQKDISKQTDLMRSGVRILVENA